MVRYGADATANPKSLLGRVWGTGAAGPFYNWCKGTVEENFRNLHFASFSTFRPATLLGTPHTPAFVAWTAPFFDKILPQKYASSDINTLASAMVYDAEQAIARGGGGGASGGGRGGGDMKVIEGDALHALYRAVPFPHGMTTAAL